MSRWKTSVSFSKPLGSRRDANLAEVILRTGNTQDKKLARDRARRQIDPVRHHDCIEPNPADLGFELGRRLCWIERITDRMGGHSDGGNRRLRPVRQQDANARRGTYSSGMQVVSDAFNCACEFGKRKRRE